MIGVFSGTKCFLAVLFKFNAHAFSCSKNIYSIIKKEFTISSQRYADIETTTNHYNITTCQSFFEKAKEKKNSLQILEKNISSKVNN